MLARSAAILVLMILTGCASSKPGIVRPGLQAQTTSIVVAYVSDKSWCFVRYIEGFPRDEICEVGDTLRYSTDFSTLKPGRPRKMPEHVFGLFDYMSQQGKDIVPISQPAPSQRSQ